MKVYKLSIPAVGAYTFLSEDLEEFTYFTGGCLNGQPCGTQILVTAHEMTEEEYKEELVRSVQATHGDTVERPAEFPYTERELDVAEKLLGEFLEAMSELGIRADSPYEQKIVDDCYDGDVLRYIRESFSNFLEQTYCE